MTIFLKSEAEDCLYQWPATFRALFSKLSGFFFSWKYIFNSKSIPESFFSSSQFPFRPFLLKESGFSPFPPAPLEIFEKILQIYFCPLLSFLVTLVITSVWGKQWGEGSTAGWCWEVTPAAQLSAPLGFKGAQISCEDSNMFIQNRTHLFSSATTLQLCLIRREKREWRAQGLWKVPLFSKRPRCHSFFSLQKHSCLGQYCIMHADTLPWRMITNSYLHS